MHCTMRCVSAGIARIASPRSLSNYCSRQEVATMWPLPCNQCNQSYNTIVDRLAMLFMADTGHLLGQYTQLL